MSRISRREFLKTLAMLAGGTLAGTWLGGCSPAPVEPAAATADTGRPATPAPGRPTPAAAPRGAPDLVVARQGKPETMVEKTIAALGGMGRFVPQGATVVIKPNICVAYHTYEYAATTNPWVVGALVRLCLEAGAAKVKVLDNPFGGTAEEAYTRSGIAEQVQAAGGEMLVMPAVKFMKTELPDGKDLHKVNIFEDVRKADVLIDVPLAKHHNLALLTLGMKTLMGVIDQRASMHRNLGQRLADLAGFLRPALTVVDAVRVLMDNGPTGGSLDDVKQMNTLIASPDIVAADSYGASLFGKQPEEIAYIKAGAAMGLGRSDLKQRKIEEIWLEDA